MCRRLSLFLCISVVAVSTGPEPRVVAAAPKCDTNCRTKFDFYLCNTGPGTDTCISFSAETCLWCTQNGCVNDTPSSNKPCQQTLPSPTYVPAYTWNGCSPACTCPSTQTYVNADSSGNSSNPISAQIYVCRN